MKARNIKSLFWDKRLEHDYSVEASYLYIYLLTCKHIGLTPYFLLVDRYIAFETGLTTNQIEKAKQELTERKQVYFFKNWVFIKNADEHNSYRTSPTTKIAYERELANIPTEVTDYFNCVDVDNYVDNQAKDKEKDRVSIPYRQGMDTHITSNITSNINNNKGGVGGKPSKTERANTELLEAANKLVEVYNEVFSKNLKSGSPLVPNLEYWLKTYDLDDVLEAMRKSKQHDFWGDKITPELLLRRKNPRGENVDRVGEMLNYQPKKQFTNENKNKYDNF